MSNEAEEIVGELADVVVWMSGSSDFSQEGKAGEAWASWGLPRLRRALTFLAKQGRPLDDPSRALPTKSEGEP